jgi:hypothetical protein
VSSLHVHLAECHVINALLDADTKEHKGYHSTDDDDRDDTTGDCQSLAESRKATAAAVNTSLTIFALAVIALSGFNASAFRGAVGIRGAFGRDVPFAKSEKA